MANVIESYPSIKLGLLTMERCNGGIDRERTEAVALDDTENFMSTMEPEHLDRVEAWLASLPFGSLEDFVDGDQEDIERMIREHGQVAEDASALFEGLFN